MADNRVSYGFKIHRALRGHNMPSPVEYTLASGYAGSLNSVSVDLRKGDVVKRLSTGHIAHCDGTEGTPAIPLGVVVGFGPYWNGSEMFFNNYIPTGQGAYGSNLARQTKVLVVPIEDAIWEADVNLTSASWDTLAEFQAFRGENVEIINASTAGFANPRISLTTHDTTATLMFKIEDVSPTEENRDFAGANVKLLVRANLAQNDQVLGV